MKLFKEFMRRTEGKWVSQRRYLYPKTSSIENLSSDLVVRFEGEEGEEFRVILSWKTLAVETGKLVSEGEMLTEAKDGKLYRNVGYLSDEPTICEVEMVDADCVVLSTSYCNMNFREEIRLVGEDIRLRQTLGMRGVEVFMVGQYYETRVQT